MEEHITIDGKVYIVKPANDFPFGNVCRQCAFYLTDCYDRDDFNCHADSRPDGVGVVFVLKDSEEK